MPNNLIAGDIVPSPVTWVAGTTLLVVTPFTDITRK